MKEMESLDEDVALAVSILFGRKCTPLTGGYGHFEGAGTRRFVWGGGVPFDTYFHVSVWADIPLGDLQYGLGTNLPFTLKDNTEIMLYINDKPYRAKWHTSPGNPCRIVHIIPTTSRSSEWLVGTLCNDKYSTWRESVQVMAA